MSVTDPIIRDLKETLGSEVEAALNPVEVEGFYRDNHECGALALKAGAGKLLLSPPTPRPKKS
ncbi:hypothetical protein QWM81_19650 [Streptomyces ficellus]|uniref:Uncharacterized protein n=1 Tax=Streptomyces ficellus TaxID=1977088 RepID=A0ABT7Z9R9_9ACTN|nr:hypothetical protein [Streptomyces ficellus]MDN3296235.1 hypothetical protein [Streptomyces ficellus]